MQYSNKDSNTITLGLLPRQREAIEALTDSTTDLILYGGAIAGGKTFLGCVWLVTMCLQYPNTRYLLARKRFVDLRQSTIRTFLDVLDKMGVRQHFKYNKQLNEITCSNGSEIILRALEITPSQEALAELSGLEITAAWWDEGEELDKKVYEKINERLGRKGNREYNILPKFLITTNPTKNFLFDIYKQYESGVLPQNIKFIQALPGDNHHLAESYISRLTPFFLGEAKYQVQVLGDWNYVISDYDLFDADELNKCYKQGRVLPVDIDERNKYIKQSTFYITCDPASLGDRAVIMVWEGLKLIQTHIYQNIELNLLEREIRGYMREFDVPPARVIVDGVGLGLSIVQNLNCIKFLANGRAYNSENFQMLKDECYYKFSEYVRNGVLEFYSMDEYKEDLNKELIAHKQHNITGEKKSKVTPKDIVKKSIGKSPDLSDAAVMRMLFELMPVGPRTIRSFKIERG